MRRQIRLFFTALTFLTRLPFSTWSDHESGATARCTPYFPVVGLVVGGIGAGVYRLTTLLYPTTFAAIAGIAATAIVTGAFHEDAFADVCDGFGAWTPKRRLEIMRDSRVGSYGVTGLVLMIGAKAALLASMPVWLAPVAFIAAHAAARWSSLLMMACFPAVTDSGSLAKPFADTRSLPRLIAGTLLAVAIASIAGPVPTGVLFALIVLLCLAAGRFFKSWLGGISGDCLGAVIQIAELAGYAVIARSHLLEALVLHLFRG